MNWSIYDGGKPIAAEALLRWKNERYGELTPIRFLADIEQENGFRELGYWILRSVMLDGKLFTDADPAFMVCVNVSSRQVMDAYFTDVISDLAAETGFPLHNLCLELSRDCRDLSAEKTFVAPLRELGVQVGIDDYGSGNAWLDTLRALRTDYVKVSLFLCQMIRAKAQRQRVAQRQRHRAVHHHAGAVDDSWIVPPGQLQLYTFAGGKINGLLRRVDRRRGLHRAAQHKRHAVADPAVDSAVVIAHGAHGAVLHPQRVIALAAAQLGERETVTELHALDGGNRKQNMRKLPLQRVEPRLSHARG